MIWCSSERVNYMMQKEEYNLLVFPICYSLQAWLDHIRFLKLGLPRALFS
jgi:hypothetical protein